MDYIFISGLSAETIIGIYDWERTTPQRVSVDLVIATDTAAAAASDDIADTLNYKALSKRLEAAIVESRCELIERLAEVLAAIVRAEFGAPWLRLTLHKPDALSNSRDVGLVIERGRRPDPAPPDVT